LSVSLGETELWGEEASAAEELSEWHQELPETTWEQLKKGE